MSVRDTISSALGALQRCDDYGTLMVPVNVAFPDQFTLSAAKKACALSGGYIPYNTSRYQQCAGRLLNRMKSQFNLTTELSVFVRTAEDTALPGPNMRHIICFLRKCCLYRF